MTLRSSSGGYGGTNNRRGGFSSGYGATTNRYTGNSGFNHRPRIHYNQRGVSRKGHLIWDYCHLKGHTREICYKLNGYPSNRKKKVGSMSRNHTSNVTIYGHSSIVF